jgi:Zn-dependent protease
MRAIRWKRQIEILRFRGVPVYAHWSVLLISALILLGAFDRPREVIVVLTCFFGVLLIHECGHLIAAHRKRCEVLSIKLYPIIGFTFFEEPRSRYDLSVIAWGGVVAQAVVAFPIIAWVTIFGFTRSNLVNIAFLILGFYSLFVAAFNLLPVEGLDGRHAWFLVYAVFDNARFRLRMRSMRRGR